MKKFIVFLIFTLSTIFAQESLNDNGAIKLKEIGESGSEKELNLVDENSSPKNEEVEEEKLVQDQDHYKDQLERYHQFRKKMLQRIFKDFDDDDFGMNDDFFSSPFSQIDKMLKTNGTKGSNVNFEWTENSDGKILTVKSKSKDTPIDVNIKNGMISISGRVIEKNEFGTSVSSFSNSFNVPDGVDESKVKIDQKENGEMTLFFPYSSGAKTLPDKKDPVVNPAKKRIQIPGEVSI